MGLRQRLLDWAAKRIAPGSAGGQGAGFTDAFRSEPAPMDEDLINAFDGIAYAATSINASACATIPLKLFVTTKAGENKPKCATAEVNKTDLEFLKSSPQLRHKLVGSQRVEEVTDHLILDSLRNGNEEMHGYDMMHMTSCYLDIVGRVYWGLEEDASRLGVKSKVWLLPPHQTKAVGRNGIAYGPIDHYEWQQSGRLEKPISFDVEDVMKFRCASLKEPYKDCWSPLRAAWEKVRWLNLDSAEHNAMTRNRSLPELIVSPKDQTDIFSDTEAARLERVFNTRFKARKIGGVHVSRVPMDVHSPTRSSRDDERSLRWQMYKNLVLNAFGTPIALFEAKQINRATLEAAMVQHGKFTVLPRLMYIVQVLNHRFVSRFSDRLFLWFENPIPKDEEKLASVRAKNLDSLLTSVNEERAKMEMGPVDWGQRPWRKTDTIPLDTPVLDPNKALEASKQQPADKPKPKKDEKKDGSLVLQRSLVLLDHCAKRMSLAQAIKSLARLGITVDDAVRMLTASAPESDAFGHEAPQEPTLPNWYRLDDRGGHRRSLPSGAGFEPKLKTYFREQREYIVKVLREQLMRAADSLVKVVRDDVFDFGKWDALLSQLAEPFLMIEVDKGIADANQRLRREALTVVNPRVREAVHKMAMQFAHSTNITTSTEIKAAMQKLRERLGEVMMGDENTIAELTRAVQEVFDKAEDFRARRIAITESSRAVHLGQRMAGEASGIVKGWEWLLSSDACPICQSIKASNPDGIPLNGSFGVISDNPIYGEVKEPPAHPHCQCTMVEKIDWAALELPPALQPTGE